MIRSSKLNINYANTGKLETLTVLMDEMTLAVNQYIDVLWTNQDFVSKYVDFKVNTDLTATMQQCLGKQALEIVKSQRKKKKKTKPIFKGKSFNLDSRLVDFQADENMFDLWIRLKSLGKGLQLRLPSKKHKQFNKFSSWKQKKSIRLNRTRDRSFSVTVFFEKKTPPTKKKGKTIGVDVGYKKLLVVSTGKVLDDGLEACYEKIARKKQGSKSFKRSITERDNLINQSLNQMSFYGIKEIVCEDLKGVKYKSKGRIRKKFNNKLQRWAYPKVLDKLSRLTDEAGVLLTRRPSAYTSQKCSMCGVIRKGNRQGETYRCACGNMMDADLNASVNLSHMGVYSPHVRNTFRRKI
jgi:IS605 OrfB family transposase